MATPTQTLPPRPSVLAAVSTAGDVEILDPYSGAVLRKLATGAIGDEISVSPDGARVYYMTASGCRGQVRAVPTAGGATSVVADGSYPTVNRQGTRLAYVQEPLLRGGSQNAACGPDTFAPAAYAVVVRDLATGSEKRLTLPPAVVANGLPRPIDHLSWGRDGYTMAVSMAGGQDNAQWGISLVNTDRDPYYADAGQIYSQPSPPARGFYYREAAMISDGQLLVNVVCCSGIPAKVMSSEMSMMTAGGNRLRLVATGLTDRDHTSLGVHQPQAYWWLYVSGTDLEVSALGTKPSTLATGLVAAGW